MKWYIRFLVFSNEIFKIIDNYLKVVKNRKIYKWYNIKNYYELASIKLY